VLFNLIQNAIRHTPAEGSVVVRAAPAGQLVQVEVADGGPGIPPDERDLVLEPFFRGNGGEGGGAGLGLAISKAIVEAHGGRLCWPTRGRGRACASTCRVPPAYALTRSCSRPAAGSLPAQRDRDGMTPGQ
jgi:signal transduction histidine kinase